MKTFAQTSILVLLMAVCLGSQGVVSRGVKPMPRGEPSGLPFHAKFTDVASEAGLKMPVIYGEVDHKDYILETVGSGAAFFDYDNDGWIDIFSPLRHTPEERTPGGYQPALQKQPGWHLSGRDFGFWFGPFRGGASSVLAGRFHGNVQGPRLIGWLRFERTREL